MVNQTEMNKYFLREDLFIKNGIFYFDKGNEEFEEVTKSNFFEAFSLYGWEEIDYLWETQLNKYFLLLDCGSNGDCLFHCVSEALNLQKIYKGKNEDEDDFKDVNDLRIIASNEINDDNFNIILETYKLEDELGEFQGYWDPVDILTKEDLQCEIRKNGNNFWGDHIIIQLLSKALNINFIILNSDDDTDTISFTHVNTNNKNYNIIIYYENKCHYKLVGKFDGKKMQVLFKTIPKYIIELNK